MEVANFLTLTSSTTTKVFTALKVEVFNGITYLDILIGAIAIEVVIETVLWYIEKDG